MMDAKAMISKGESETLEFKESLALKDEIGEGVSALSNTSGGMILVGVNDRSDIVGVEIGKKTLEDLANYIKTNTDNHVFPKISLIEAEGKDVVVIEFKVSDEKPVFFKGKAYGRVGNSTHRLSASEIRKMAKESGKMVYWDELICENATLADIDEEKVRWFLRKAKFERNFKIEPEMPVGEALERLELMKSGSLTNAAVLLFAKNPQRFFLQAETRCSRFKGTEPVKPFIDMKVFGGNIFDQVEQSVGFVLEHIPLKVYLAGKPEREEKYEYPPDAIREAIVNAVCHRDYGESSNAQVRIFDDRIEVWGSGPLPEPLTPEDLKKKHRSVLRNPRIAKCFFLVKFLERWGTGTNDIISMCRDWELPEPLFEEVTGTLVVTFRKHRLTDEIIKELNERQKKAIEYIKANKRISRSDYASLTGCSIRTAFNDLQGMVSKNILQTRGKGKSTYYELA